MPKGVKSVTADEPSNERVKRLKAKMKELELQKRLLDLEIEKCKVEIEFAEQKEDVEN